MMWGSIEVTSIPLELSDLTDQELVELNMQIIQKDNEIGDLNESLLALSKARSIMQRINERQQLKATSFVV